MVRALDGPMPMLIIVMPPALGQGTVKIGFKMGPQKLRVARIDFLEASDLLGCLRKRIGNEGFGKKHLG